MKRILVSLLVISGTLRAMQHAAPSTVQVRCSDGVVLTVSRDVLEESGYFKGCLAFPGSEQQTGVIAFENIDSGTVRVIASVLEAMHTMQELAQREDAVSAVLGRYAYEPEDLENLAQIADYLDIPELHSIALQMLFEHPKTPGMFVNNEIGLRERFACNEPLLQSAACRKLGAHRARVFEHTSPIYALAMRPDNKEIMVGMRDRAAVLWNLETVEQVLLFETQQSCDVLAWSPCGTYILMRHDACQMDIWDVQAQSLESRVRYPQPISSAAWSPNGKYIVFGYGSTVSVFDYKNGVTVSTLLTDAPVTTVAWSPVNNQIAFGLQDRSFWLWNHRANARTVCSHDLVSACAWSPDGTRIATNGDSHFAYILDDSLRCIHELRHPCFVLSVAYSPDNKYVATGCVDNRVRVWDARTGKLITEMDHQAAVRAVTWSHCGRYVIAGSDDGRVIAWDCLLRGCEAVSYRQSIFLAWLASLQETDIELDDRFYALYSSLTNETREDLAEKGYVFTRKEQDKASNCSIQ